jgi:two-component system response regulator MtrA
VVSELKGPFVLVVDDDEDIAQSIGDVLRNGGYAYELVSDGAQALDLAKRRTIGMVLLDWRLPDEPAGATLVRRLRDACGGQVPVVVLSADPISLNEARDANVDDYLPKPFEIADLLDLVDQYMKS